MTRINTIEPRFLCGKHLMAEYRELPRVLTALHRYGPDALRAVAGDAPEYRLGTGHVVFFYDKLTWLYRRHLQLKAEMVFRSACRGTRPTLTIDLHDDFQSALALVPELCNDWTPTPEAHALNIERLLVRMSASRSSNELNGVALKTPEELRGWFILVCLHHGVDYKALPAYHLLAGETA